MNTEFEKSNDYNTITLSVGNDTDTPKEIKLTPEGSSYFENDSPEISEKDFQDMYISQGKNEMEKMERRFEIWLENRDDDFTLDMWDFRCLQSFIDSEIQLAEQKAREELMKKLYSSIQDDYIECTIGYFLKDQAEILGIKINS